MLRGGEVAEGSDRMPRDELCSSKFVNCGIPSNHILKLKPPFIAVTYLGKRRINLLKA